MKPFFFRSATGLFILSLISLLPVRAQQVPGLHLSNYGGLYRATYNPAALGGSRYRWQLNVASLGSTINGRYFTFLGRNSLFYPLLAPHSTDELYGRSRTMGSLSQGDPVYLASDIRWPSVMVSMGRRHGIAFQFRSRGYVTGENIPAGIRTLYFRRLDTPATPVEQGEWGEFRLLQQSFSEASFSYGILLLDLPAHKLRAGGTAKKIFGARAAYLRGTVDRYQIQPVATSETEKELVLNGFTYESGYSQPNQPLRVSDLFDAQQYAQGWGYDLGASYELGSVWDKGKIDNDARSGYLIRLSASLTDLGAIQYQTASSQVTAGQQSRTVIGQEALETMADRSADGFIDLFPAQSTTTLAGEAPLPAAVHLEADLQLMRSFFINVAQTKRYGQPEGPLAISQPNVLSITPRFEGEDNDIAFPISFIEGNKTVTVGLLARFGPIFAGFSNLGGMLKGRAAIPGAPRASFMYVGFSLWKLKETAATKQ
ncbi:DUF5723 family protein [Telluribacter sp.]|jgi:hypothetical protein|uniref:DUF5723 family protein n=1 Tax=Telluribacter sp. TaxID=1978767 RepID=UPI002E0F22F5|nr:DUF5723 family protein [Telluribacter sp.]